MKFTKEQRADIKDAILIRCTGTDYQTFQIEEIDRMVDEIDELVNKVDIIDSVSNQRELLIAFSKWWNGQEYTKDSKELDAFDEHYRNL